MSRPLLSIARKIPNGFRLCFSTDPGAPTKSMEIESSIKLYLTRVKSYRTALEHERARYERGRRYLAQIMGEDPEAFTQEKIDEAIRYLFPSGLFSLSARPKMKPPEEIFPPQKKLQYDSYGRPLHHLFYTRQPNYFSLMNEAVYELERLKLEQDMTLLPGSQKLAREQTPLNLVASEWFTKSELEKVLSESIWDQQYEKWLSVMNRIATHPMASLATAFISRHRTQQRVMHDEVKYPEPQEDPITKQKFVKAYGQKKHSFAEATLYMPGSGQIQINEKRLLEMFPNLGDREQIMFPLQLTRMLGHVDITAKVEGEGCSSNANALRTAISRCLASLLPQVQGKRPLTVAGLLTQDERFAERKKPGQKKARKKPIWKAR